MGPDPAVVAVRLAVRRDLADLPPGALVVAACSGGADSLALTAALAYEAPRAGLAAGVVTVDHGLQAGSAGRARSVLATARSLGVAVAECLTVDVGTAGGPEAAARTARYEAIDAAADRLGAAAVLLGHTRDDQAETVLLGLARGSGARSLAGMAPRRGRLRRPLLELARGTTEAACAALGLSPWHDPHNTDPAYARARVRAEGLPALERALGPGVAQALARTATLLQADLAAWEELTEQARRQATGDDGSLELAVLADLPGALRTRVLRAAAVAAGAPGGALGAVHVEAMEALATGRPGRGAAALPGRLAVVRRSGRLHFHASG
ncbi:MAG: tRNA lysidine(34) synthetase TilS [Mycobacteriales bacterium]